MEGDDPIAAVLPQIAPASAAAAGWALQNLRRHDPEFEIPFSTLKLSGIQRIEEHLDHDNLQKMLDVYGVSDEAFARLIDELGLQDSKYVAKEDKLAMLLRTVRSSASLRSIQDAISEIDSHLLRKHLPSAEQEMCSLIRLQGVGNNITTSFTRVEFHFTNAGGVKISLGTAVYVVPYLSTRRILGNDVLVLDAPPST
jgi:hypothetical protein